MCCNEWVAFRCAVTPVEGSLQKCPSNCDEQPKNTTAGQPQLQEVLVALDLHVEEMVELVELVVVELVLLGVMHFLTEGETVEMEYSHQSQEQLHIMLVVVVADHITLYLQLEVVQEVKVVVELVEQLDKIALVSLVLQILVAVVVEHPLQEVEIKMEVQEALEL